jgi:sucrose-phosphate synthase
MGLYIQMHSMHGLFRSKNLELGRDEDTGGQIVYVLELAKALGELKSVDKVDIITRRIIDSEYPGYSKRNEKVSDKVSVVRIECGPEEYIKKVDLWPFIDEFVENTKKYIKKIKRKPDILQSNYADSGFACAKLSEELGIPQVHTGHSLGIPKMKKLGVNDSNFAEYNKVFHFDKRLKAEQKAIDNSSAIIASTNDEIKKQYKNYKLKKNQGKFRLITPGVDLNRFFPPAKKSKTVEQEKNHQLFQNVIDQNVKHPERIIITALSRLDKRKNIHGLIKAFAEDRELQSMANLVVFAKTLEGEGEEQKIIRRINSIIRKTNLYDNIALPAIKLEHENQVPDYYRFVSEKKGIFVNPALIEPFGLTILEASACGVPVVATKNGGPSEIIEDGETGFLVDPKNRREISSKIKKLIRHRDVWKKISKNAIKNVKKHYTWKASAKKYLRVFKQCVKLKKHLS